MRVEVKPQDFWNDETSEFIHVSGGILTLEHSLYTISKWESKWKKVFLVMFSPGRGYYKVSDEEFKDMLIDYIDCMSLEKEVYPHNEKYLDSTYDDDICKYIDSETVEEIMDYINDPQGPKSATPEPTKKDSKQTLSSLYIYALMASYRIPFECDRWHLNRLLSLIEKCGVLNSPKDKKRSRRDLISDFERINAQNRARYKTKG